MLRSKEMEDHGKYLGPLFLLPSSFLLLSLISQIYPETILLFQKQENFRKTSTSASLTTLKPLTMWITANCGKFLKEIGIPDHLTCILRSLYAGQEATVRTGHRTTNWFKIGKGVHQGCILSPCLFNLHAEYLMRNAGLDEAQAGIKTVRRNINTLRYADDTTLMAVKRNWRASWWRWKRRVKKWA